jgi:hypothetical protein
VAFASVFVSLLLSAFHSPRPHDVPIGIVGPDQIVSEAQDALSSTSPGAFNFHRYDSQAGARTAIAHRTIDGALVVAPTNLRLLLAGAGGTASAQALTAASKALAGRDAVTLSVVDIVPPRAGDSQALAPFFVILGALIPSLAAGIACALVLRRAGPLWRVGTLVAVAVITGIVVAGITGGFTGLGPYWAIAGLVALFSLAVSAPTAALGQVAVPALPLAFLAMVAFGVPVSGGAANLAAFSPGYLRALDFVLPPGLAVSALRDAVYFSGYGTDGRAWVLAVWAAVGLLALVAVSAARSSTEPANPMAVRPTETRAAAFR